MLCGFEELKRKEVIDIRTGERLGYIDDIEINMTDGRLEKLIIYGGTRLFGILGREEDSFLSCSEIKVIGREIILVETEKNALGMVLPKNDDKSSESLSE